MCRLGFTAAAAFFTVGGFMEQEFKSGFVSVVGRPNVGKSTLINRILGQKVTIVSDKAQTTRNKILCIHTDADSQIVFLDTPGIHKPKHKLGRFMDEAENVSAVMGELKKILPPGPKYFPDDMITDRPERLLVAEIVREKLLQLTREEVPHALAVYTEEMAKRENNKVYIRVTVYVERDSQKRIVIGKNGSVLKEIGRLARTEIERLLGSSVFLDIWVKVKTDWRNKASVLSEFGYKDE